MTIFTNDPPSSRGLSIRDLGTAPLGDVLEASFEEGWLYSPLSSIGRLGELKRAEGAFARENVSPRRRRGRETTEELEAAGELSPVISKEQADERIKAAAVSGLTIPEEGIREDALAILIERKREEEARRSVISRAPEGITPTVLTLGASMVGGMMDPLNVASAFVPVVSAPRYAQMLSRAGSGGFSRAAVRARVGAVEGAAGAALVEPIVISAAQAEQADYTITDSLLNIAFGSVMGGGLHMGAGALGDAFSRGRGPGGMEPEGPTGERVNTFSHEQKATVGRVALAQAVSGKRVNVGPVIDFFGEANKVRPPTMEAARRAVIEAEGDRMRAQVEADAGQRVTAEELEVMRAERAEVAERLDRLDSMLPERTKQIQRQKKVGADRAEPMARKEIESVREQLTERARTLDIEIARGERASTVEADRAALERGEVPERFEAEIDAEARALFEQMGTGAPVDRATARTIAANVPDSLRQAYADVRRSARAQDDTLSTVADEEAAAAIQARLDEAVDDTDPGAVLQSVRDAEQDLQTVAERTGDDVTEVIENAKQITDEATAFREGFRVYAACRMRNG